MFGLSVKIVAGKVGKKTELCKKSSLNLVRLLPVDGTTGIWLVAISKKQGCFFFFTTPHLHKSSCKEEIISMIYKIQQHCRLRIHK